MVLKTLRRYWQLGVVVIGAALLVTGVTLVYVPAGLMTAGVLLLVSVLHDFDRNRA